MGEAATSCGRNSRGQNVILIQEERDPTRQQGFLIPSLLGRRTPILLYRVVSPAEWLDIQANGFQPGPPSYQGKWFAELDADVRTWGTALYGTSSCHVIEVDVPEDLVNRFYQDRFLDRIGPARFADLEQLPELNQRMQPPIAVT